MTASEDPELAPTAARLAQSRTVAPDGLADDVLVATAVADGFATWPSPIGDLVVAFSPAGVLAVRRAEEREALARDHERRTGRRLLQVRAAPPALRRRVDRALATGRLGDLDVPLADVTPFQRAVLTTTASIPPGEVRPYAWVAREIGRPGATRAVGTALARNPAPVLIPCHRVVRRDGRIGAYALGTDAKRTLLLAEGLDVDRLEADAAAGRRWLGSTTTGVVCHPTCRHARRIAEPHRRWFASARAATDAGFRPCAVCRPLP